ncbi:unnamed protein product [Closterium sp. NIES-65]|nr:unnamed protein product [Closterium sp. NIES-65]
MKVPDPLTVEHAVTAIFNICRMEAGQKEIFSEGGLESLVDVLRAAENNEAARENAAAAIFCLANTEERKQLVTERGALPPLVGLLQTSSVRGQRDAILTIWSLVRWLCACSLYGFPGDTAAGDAGCHSEATAARAGAGAGASVAAAEVGAGGAGEGRRREAVMPQRQQMVQEAAGGQQRGQWEGEQGGRRAIWEANGVEGVCDVLEMSSQRAKEEAVATLLRMAGSDTRVKAVLVREGVIPALYKIHKESEGNAGVKAKTLLDMLRTTWK